MNSIVRAKQIVDRIEAGSRRSIEGKGLLESYITQSLLGEAPITFFNWECPPRFIDWTERNESFINYDVDMAKIKKGEQIDEYTEIPRVVERSEDEKRILSELEDCGILFRFAKLIADTNAQFLTPISLEILGQERVKQSFDRFKEVIEGEVRDYPVPVGVVLFWELVESEGLETEYERIFDKAYKALEADAGQLLDPISIVRQFERTREHVGIKDQKWVREFSLRTIATYGAEGIILDELSKRPIFSNCVWLNIEEVDDRTIAITNFWRRKKGLGDMPMIFPK